MESKIPVFYKVEVQLTDRENLKMLLDTIHPDVAGRKAKKKENYFVVEALLDEAQIEWLKKNGYTYKVIENATEVGKERQKEVGKGNRFENPNTVPKGLGKKIK